MAHYPFIGLRKCKRSCAATLKISMAICSTDSNQNQSNANVSLTQDGAFNLMLLFSSSEGHSADLPLLVENWMSNLDEK